MTDKEILEGNKRIAEFMGWDTCEYVERITNIRHPNFNKTGTKINAFCLPDTHDIVCAIYTDRPGYRWDYEKEDDNGNTINRLIFDYDDLKFNSSWDWLMPVVERIENLEFGKWYVHIQGNTVSIEDGNDGIGLWDFHINNEDPCMSLHQSDKNLKPIEAVYIAVTEFIKWYNESKRAIS